MGRIWASDGHLRRFDGPGYGMGGKAMKTAYTPGPWVIEENVTVGGINHLAITARHAGGSWMPCSVSPMRFARDVDQANARLIAATPELLEALKLVLIFHDSGPWTSEKAQEWANGLTRLMGLAAGRRELPSNEATTKNLRTAVRAAIDKATGGNP